jgi:glycosyltransferase involved in cell wall biosynthesis
VSRQPARVTFFCDSTWAGGAERYLYLLAKHLDRDAFEPTLVVNRNSGLDEFSRSFERAGVPVHEVALDSPAGVPAFMSLVRRLAPSIFHCNLPGPWSSRYSLVAPLARLAGADHVVSTEHLPMVPPFLKGELLRRFGGRSIERVITVSEDNVRHLVQLHGVQRRKIRVVRLGIPAPATGRVAAIRGELGLAGDDFLCVIVGTLEARKGHLLALEVLAALDERVKLLIAGRGELEGALRERAAALGVEARVHLLGFRADINALLRECNALLCPSTLEATPYVILEAMAAGLPVVASRIYGIPELVLDGETGILVDPGAREGFVGAIAALERDHARAARLGEAGKRRYAAEFRIERCVAETQAVYRELLGAPSEQRT